MTTQEASKILKMLLGYLKGEIEPPNPKTIEEAEKFEQDGYECLNLAIRSLEAWEKVKAEIEGDIFIYNLGLTGEKIIALIDKHLQEVDGNESNV